MRRIQTGLASHFERWSRSASTSLGTFDPELGLRCCAPFRTKPGAHLSLLVHTERASTTRGFYPDPARTLEDSSPVRLATHPQPLTTKTVRGEAEGRFPEVLHHGMWRSLHPPAGVPVARSNAAAPPPDGRRGAV